MIWRIFTHLCRFTHNVPESDWLEDKSCLTPHQHGFDPNPLCKIEFRCATKNIIDFKVIKKLALEIIANAGTVINPEEEDDKGFLLQPAYYDFGTIITEDLIDDFKKLLFIALDDEGYEPIRVQVFLNETRKYAVWDDGTTLQSVDDELL
jgi:hypothetical protein